MCAGGGGGGGKGGGGGHDTVSNVNGIFENKPPHRGRASVSGRAT